MDNNQFKRDSRRERRKDASFKNLVEVKRVLDINNIFFWIQHGLLLGLYRDGDMIKNDENDIDIGIGLQDVSKFVELKPIFEKLKFRVRITYNSYKNGSMTAALKRSNVKMHVHVNCLKDDIIYQPMTRGARVMVFPKEIYSKFGIIKWRDEDFNCPKDIEEYLRLRYGNTWNIPILKGSGWTTYDDKKLNPCCRESLYE